MKRRLELDAARGAMLVWMTLTHLPTMLTPYVNQPFGYVTSSEGFIFLSALFTGRIYFRLLDRDGPRAMLSRLCERAFRLYRYHVVLLFVAFVIAAHFAVRGNHQNLHNLLDYYLTAGRAHALMNALLLVYRPPLLDILPLYLIFLALSPFILLLAEKVGWRIVLAGSFGLWTLTQFGLSQHVYDFAARHFGLRIPLNEMGAFNLWGWQFLWVAGMWMGVRWAKENLPVRHWARRLWILASFVAVALFWVRHLELRGLDLGAWQVLFDKWRLAPIHLLDFAAVAVLLIRFQSVLKRLAVRPFILLGQASLQVFCAHFLFCFLGLGLMGRADRMFGWGQFALIIGTFGSLLLVAKIFAIPRPSGRAVESVPAPELTRRAA